jgi:hypothetical protein
MKILQEPPSTALGEGSGAAGSSAGSGSGSGSAGRLTPPSHQAPGKACDKADGKGQAPHAGRRESKSRGGPSADKGGAASAAGAASARGGGSKGGDRSPNTKKKKKKKAEPKSSGRKSRKSGGSGSSFAERAPGEGAEEADAGEGEEGEEEEEEEEEEEGEEEEAEGEEDEEEEEEESSSDDEHAELPPTASVRAAKHAPRAGARVKVCFDRLKWYGGVCVTAVREGRVRIKYDDGNTEEAKYPDADIVVGALGNNNKKGNGKGHASIPCMFYSKQPNLVIPNRTRPIIRADGRRSETGRVLCSF